MDLPEPVHDEALVNLYLERISALSVSAFDGADVRDELQQVMTEAVSECDASKSAPPGNNLQVLVARLRDRAAAAEREEQPAVRETFEQALALAGATAS